MQNIATKKKEKKGLTRFAVERKWMSGDLLFDKENGVGIMQVIP